MTVTDLQPFTIGASIVPAILGLDPWDSAYAVGARLLDDTVNEAGAAAQMGLSMEKAHRELVEEAGHVVAAAPESGIAHPDLPWLCVHPDAFVFDGAGSWLPLELKCRGVAPSDAIRMRDTVQSLVQVHTMVAAQGLVSVLHGGYGGIQRDEWRVDADEELWGAIVDRCAHFLSLLRKGKLPQPDSGDATRDAIRERYARADPGRTVRATQEVWGWVKRIRELHEVEKTAHEQRQGYEHRVQDFMGDATELISPYDTPAARWRPVESTRVDTTRLKRDRPEIAGEYARTTTTRRFEAQL